jgi:hypothetical protein
VSAEVIVPDSEAPREPRAEMTMSPSFVFRTYRRDTELILRALGGRITTPTELAAARELGDRLTALRAQGIAQMNVGASIAIEHMTAARLADGLPADPLARVKKDEAA